MAQEPAKISEATEQSPVAQARVKLGLALEQLETIVLQRMEEASQLAHSAAAHSGESDGDSEQWQNACRLLEDQLAALKEENSLLHSEIHQLRDDAQQLAQHNTALEAANTSAVSALDDAIAQVEGLLKG
ncbi:MAG: hypothetical protein MK052_11190 [Alphaproteobacteria bacterium]|nr:hypothetical protein [Alphaproteobacteria bacterium]